MKCDICDTFAYIVACHFHDLSGPLRNSKGVRMCGMFICKDCIAQHCIAAHRVMLTVIDIDLLFGEISIPDVWAEVLSSHTHNVR